MSGSDPSPRDSPSASDAPYKLLVYKINRYITGSGVGDDTDDKEWVSIGSRSQSSDLISCVAVSD